MVIPVILSCVRALAHPGYCGLKGHKTVIVAGPKKLHLKKSRINPTHPISSIWCTRVSDVLRNIINIWPLYSRTLKIFRWLNLMTWQVLLSNACKNLLIQDTYKVTLVLSTSLTYHKLSYFNLSCTLTLHIVFFTDLLIQKRWTTSYHSMFTFKFSNSGLL